jgi:AraC family transcriptional regulator
MSAQKQILGNSAAPASHSSLVHSMARGGVRIEHRRATRGTIPEHADAAHQVLVMLGGRFSGAVRTEDGRLINGEPETGHVCVIPAGQAHSARCEETSEFLSIFLDPAMVSRTAHLSAGSWDGSLAGRWAPRDPVIWQIGQALLTELENEPVGVGFVTDSLVNVLAVHLLRNYAKPAQSRSLVAGGLVARRLRQAINLLEGHIEENITLEEIAASVALSRFHFSREFKRATGVAPHQYLIRLRLERAMDLLASTDLPIVEVALRSGFASQSHFTRCFRKLTATTPRAYRIEVGVSDPGAISQHE